MYTSQQIDQIMAELGLSPADSEARNIVEQLANSKPAVVVDQNFISQLRADLQQRTRATNQNEIKPSKSINIFSMFMNKTLAGALVVAVVVIAGGAWYMQSSNTPLFNGASFGGGNADQLLSGKYDVTGVKEESFGDLGKVAIISASEAAAKGGTGMNADTRTTANSASGSAELSMTAGSTEPGMPTADKMIAPGEPYPGAVYYTFNYEGPQNLTGLNEQQPVLKRSKPEQPSSLVDRIVNALSFGLIDLNTLKNIKIQNFAFVEDRDYGYAVNVDLQYGVVNIYQNWERWPQQPTYACSDVGNCVNPSQLKPEDMPSNEETIAIANDFLNEYAISKEGYASPRVADQSNWRILYEQASADQKSSIYIPDQVQVVYPLMLEGKEVYDEGGSVYGLSVMVDVRTKRVSNASELTSKQFERSDYKGETDDKRIIGIAENGGFRNSLYIDPNSRKVELKLGAPTVEMVKIYYSSDNYRTNSDLYMPAMVFPIENWKEAGYWRKNVIVPLVKSILDTDVQSQPQPMPVDLPESNVQGAATTEPAIMPENVAR